MKKDIISTIVSGGIIAIIRVDSPIAGEKIATACVSGGIKAIEIQYSTPNAITIIDVLSKKFKLSDLVLGAGSIMDSETCRLAILAGAQFVVGNHFDEEIAKCCNKFQVPYIPGCMTITEMVHAMSFGSEIIKLFPGTAFSPEYVKTIKLALPQINIMSAGGINLENVTSWIRSGSCAVGVGGDLTSAAKEENYAEVTKRAQSYIASIKEARKERA